MAGRVGGAVRDEHRDVLVVGVSTRAMAESAARAGYAVAALDAFGDMDQHLDVRAYSLARDFGRGFTARSAARAATTLTTHAVAYQSSFENHPAAVRALATGRTLWGNAPSVLERVRQPVLLAAALRRRGLPVPALATRGDAAPPTTDVRRWLLKPRASGGGHDVRRWSRGTPVPRGCYLQELIDGVPGSVVFVAAGGRSVALGVSRQLVGDPAFGASGLRYCGSILASANDAQFDADAALFDGACALAGAVAQEFGLVGVNGVDFVARGGVPHAIEVNPRYSASMELAEQRYGMSVFGAHAAACERGALPAFDLGRARRRHTGVGAIGKAVLFARRDVRIGDTRPWLGDPTVRDVPHPGEHIAAGRPVCTVFAGGTDSAACYAALVQRAARVYDELAAWERVVA